MPKAIVGLDALDFVKKYVDIIKSREFSKDKDVLSYCKSFPFIVKFSSEKLIHKTEADAVVKVVNKEHLLKVLKDFKAMAKKLKISGYKILVQDYFPGVELLLGIKKDDSFGQVIVFGVGGTFVELFKDIQFRANPLSRKDAEDMISQLKNKKLLEGFRNLPKVNKKLLVDLILAVSKLAKDHPNISELDINPLICNGKSCKAVDVRLVLE